MMLDFRRQDVELLEYAADQEGLSLILRAICRVLLVLVKANWGNNILDAAGFGGVVCS